MLRLALLVGFLVTLSSLADASWLQGYTVSSYSNNPTGFNAVLQKVANEQGPYNTPYYASLNLTVLYVDNSIVRVQIQPFSSELKSPVWQVPDVVRIAMPSTKPSNPDFVVSLVSSPFALVIVRNSDKLVLFNTTSPSTSDSGFNGLIFGEQYISWTTQLPRNGQDPKIFGLGERVQDFLLNVNQTYVMWARDQGAAIHNTNLYGVHPFYLQMVPPSTAGQPYGAHGFFMLNSNAMSVTLQSDSLTWQLSGGIIDLWLFTGSKPASVVEQYTRVIGRPHLPPYWGLGWHQCRWGYHTIEETAKVVQMYEFHDLPLDVMWNDIDYMDSYMDFTLDPVRFPTSEVQAFVDYLHEHQQHYIVIVDPGIFIDDQYEAYNQGSEMNVWITDYTGTEPLVGKVWPGYTTFPDFSHPNASAFWSGQISKFRANGPAFDGLWIDMNEISNFCTGSCTQFPVAVPSPDPWDNPPFCPTTQPLNTSTISISAQQYIGRNYDTHSMYGFSETVLTAKALENLLNRRSIVISRSTFAGSGFHGGHWLGDNFSRWSDLKLSISGVLNFQLFGIPLVGADICGFNSETTQELCSRWMQLGTLYPFSRNHNAIKMRSQEPYAFGQQHLDISRQAIRLRYLILPYFYSLFFEAHVNGSTVWRPLFFEFPSDAKTIAIDEQFMIGSSILVSPALYQNQTVVSAYFPTESSSATLWYDFFNGTQYIGGTSYNLFTPIDRINLHLRGGSILPTQFASLTTAASRNNSFMLIVAPNKQAQAKGSLIVDDGESLTTVQDKAYLSVDYTFQYNANAKQYTLTGTITNNGYPQAHNLNLGAVTLYGIPHSVSNVTVNGRPVDTFHYDRDLMSVDLTGIFARISSSLSIIFSL